MIEPVSFYRACEDLGVRFFTGVPDSLMKDFCNVLCEESVNHVISANEGSAISVAAGDYLATGNVPLVYMQNSGIGNAVNPLLSLADPDVYGIPMLILIGWRGQPGTTDEPQHMKQGKVLVPMLDAMGIDWDILPAEEAASRAVLSEALSKSLGGNCPQVILVPAKTFSSFTCDAPSDKKYELTREAAIKQVADSLGKDDVVVATTGKASRELYEHRMSSGISGKDFLTVGSMGHASQIALGIANALPHRTVYCLDGDGAMIMHLGSLPVIGQLGLVNYRHVLLNNFAHESVGGQPTASANTDFPALARTCGYRNGTSVGSIASLGKSLESFRQADGPSLLEICISKGSRSDLGRPRTSPSENKNAFMDYLKNDAT